MNVQTKQSMPTLAGGGQVIAIVPQTFEETMRVAHAVVASGLAPSALIGKKTGDDAAAAVAVCIMSGSELGLKPMVSLRSFTVINGKPALYGDGLINVVRQSGKVAFLKTGYEMREGQMIGYCHAKRNDTGEENRVEFSQAQAERAGLWDDRPTIRKQVWENNQKVWKDGQPNDAPWYKFRERMIAWRAAGYCLRELFGDVLGGIRDEFEAREIADAEDMRDITPAGRHLPPTPPSPPEPPVEEADVTEVTNEPANEVDPGAPIDATEFFQELEESMAVAMDEATVEEVWTSLDPDGTFDGDDINLDIAHKIKQRRLDQINATRSAD